MIAIREATAEDALAIAQVHVASWRWAYRDTIPAATLDTLDVGERERMWSQRLNEDDPSGETLVITDEGAVVGFCGYGPSRDLDAAAGTAEIYTIYLREQSAGRGLGRELFASANERLRGLGYDSATLWVLGTNQRTRRFYEAAGWTTDGDTDEHRLGRTALPVVRYRIELSAG